jgi:glycosyltransferase involved in cell wall biosynthesis
MAENPLATVITINYQDLEGLKRTFASLSSLAPAAFEHVVIDGGSSDGSAEWARSNTVIPDTTVLSERDAGIYDAMNKGLNLARGTYCIFVNSGDEMLVGEDLVELLEALKSSGKKWLVGRCLLVDPESSRNFIKPPRWNAYHWWVQTFLNYEVCHPSVAMETALLRSLGGFDTRLAIAADYKLLTAIGRKHVPFTTDSVISKFVRGGVSDIRFDDSLMECHRARLDVIPWLRPLAILDLIWTRALIWRTRRRRKPILDSPVRDS